MCLTELWVAFGVKDNLRYIPTHEIAATLGPSKSKALLFFTAFTGCDTVSFFAGKGNKSAWKTWMAYPQVTYAFCQLTDHQEGEIDVVCMAIIERIVILLYDRTSDLSSVNEAKTEMFENKQRSIVNCPPTLEALKQHVRRDVLQVYGWIKAPECNPESRDNPD